MDSWNEIIYERERKQRCSAGLSARLCRKYFQWNQWKQGMMKGGAAIYYNTTPCGLETMPGPDPTWAKTEDIATLLLMLCLSASFSFVFLFQSPISGPSTSLYLSDVPSFLFFALFFFLLLLFAVSVPHQYLITLILFMQETNTCTHIVSSPPVIFSSRLSCFYFFFSPSNSYDTRQCNKMPKFSCRKQFIQQVIFAFTTLVVWKSLWLSLKLSAFKQPGCLI